MIRLDFLRATLLAPVAALFGRKRAPAEPVGRVEDESPPPPVEHDDFYLRLILLREQVRACGVEPDRFRCSHQTLAAMTRSVSPYSAQVFQVDRQILVLKVDGMEWQPDPGMAYGRLGVSGRLSARSDAARLFMSGPDRTLIRWSTMSDPHIWSR